MWKPAGQRMYESSGRWGAMICWRAPPLGMGPFPRHPCKDEPLDATSSCLQLLGAQQTHAPSHLPFSDKYARPSRIVLAINTTHCWHPTCSTVADAACSPRFQRVNNTPNNPATASPLVATETTDSLHHLSRPQPAFEPAPQRKTSSCFPGSRDRVSRM